jgi:hypothetical protein
MAAEALMVDTCTISRVTNRTTDTSTADVTETRIPVYAGPCRIQQHARTDSREDIGEASLILVRFELQLPVATSAGIAAEDIVTMTGSALDPDLVGREFTVMQVAHKTHATARRMQVQEVTS